MSACLSITNLSKKAVSVYVDDEFFSFILPEETTICKLLSAGSISLKVLGNRNNTLFDTWLAIKPATRHTLEIYDTGFSFKPNSHS